MDSLTAEDGRDLDETRSEMLDKREEMRRTCKSDGGQDTGPRGWRCMRNC